MEQLLSNRIKATPPSFVRGILAAASDESVISFAGGLPNPISFPNEALKESSARIIDTYKSVVFQYSTTAGLILLRKYIAEKYNRQFQLDVTADDVLITTGSQQALDLIAKVLVNEGDNIVVEEPGYLGAIQAFSQYQPTFLPVTLQEDGLCIEELKKVLEKNPKFIYTVPNFQNPTGLTYSKENRDQVYACLKDSDTVLIEDDPYGELRFEGEALPYIGAGKLKNSIVLGTLSKTVTPGMRLGFIICKNRELLRYISIAKEASDLHTNIFGQYLIYDYLTHNDHERHIQKIRDLYQKQATTMMQAIEEYFPKEVKFTKPKGGMFLWVALPEEMSALSIFPKALENKVAFVPGDPFYTNRTNVNTMRLNYTNAEEETIVEGIKRLGKIFSENNK